MVVGDFEAMETALQNVWTLHQSVRLLEQQRGRSVRKPTKQLWIAVVIGFAISAALFNLAYATHSSVLEMPQLIGFLVCMLLRGGVHSATKTDYALIALPVNAAIYASVIFMLLRVIWRAKTN